MNNFDQLLKTETVMNRNSQYQVFRVIHVGLLLICSLGVMPTDLSYGQSLAEIQELAQADTNEQKMHQLATLGEYASATKMGEQVLRIRKRIFGKEHPIYADSLNNLAANYSQMGSYKLAEPLLLEAKQVYEKVLGKEHLDYAKCLFNLAGLYDSIGSYERAEPLLLEAKKVYEKVLGKEHPDYAASLDNLAGLCFSTGSHSQAESLYLEAKNIREKILGKENIEYAISLNNLAWLYCNTGSYGRAEPLYLEAQKICEKVVGKEHPYSATVVNDLAAVYAHKGAYKRAESLYLQAQKIREKIFGSEHPAYADSLNNLAALYCRMGSYERAEQVYIEANRIQFKLLGKEHPHCAIGLNNLGFVKLSLGKINSAFANLERSRRSVYVHATRLLPSLSQKRKEAFLKENYRSYFHQALSVGLKFAGNSVFANQAASWVINGKAIGQEALASRNLAARDSDNAIVRGKVNKLKLAREKLAHLTLSSPQPNQQLARREQVNRLALRVQELSRQIVSVTGENLNRRKWTELGDVQNMIPNQTALIELVQFSEFDFKAQKDKQWKSARYAAWIITRDGDVQVVDLGIAKPINDAIAKVTTPLSKGGEIVKELAKLGEKEAVKKLNVDLAAVAKLVWEPIAAKLPAETNKLIISPDSSLWLLPWTALPTDDGKFLLEKYAIQLETTGRYLVHHTNTTQVDDRAYVFADPDFDLSPELTRKSIQTLIPNKELDESQRGETSQSSLGRVGRLPFTKVEANAVTPSLKRLTTKKPFVYSGQWAIESVLKALKRPKILMLSTHGFFLPDQKVEPKGNLGLNSDTRSSAMISTDGEPIENPLLRCGLLLAGCNTNSVVAGDDGVFTGMEVVSLDLRGTELVVLSACETGVGKVNNGEGVAGLRQAFQLAGAESVLASLWQVDDAETARLMNLFFDNLAKGKSKSEALRQAQLSRIKSRRARHGAAHPFFWAAFTLTGQD